MIILGITRIIEFTVLYVLINWIWASIGNSYGIALSLAFISLYGLYLGVTLSNDYHEMKYGVGEPME